jgi:hypothetical protein
MAFTWEIVIGGRCLLLLFMILFIWEIFLGVFLMLFLIYLAPLPLILYKKFFKKILYLEKFPIKISSKIISKNTISKNYYIKNLIF